MFKLLQSKGVRQFYHANTVKTALTYIQHGALLSRSYVERNQLLQTDQDSDNIDKKFNIWDTVFMDGKDLHNLFGRRNLYGPILFEMRLEVLLEIDWKGIAVTKENPSYWREGPLYFEKLTEIEEKYNKGNKLQDGKTMFLFNSPEKSIKLDQFCNKILIDDPFKNFKAHDGSVKSIGDAIQNRIDNALGKANLSNIKTELRHNNRIPCSCRNEYHRMNRLKFDNLFLKGNDQ